MISNTIENITSCELTKAYVAQNFARYLIVNPPEAPAEFKRMARAKAVWDALFKTIEALDSAYYFVFNPEQYKLKQKYLKEEEEILKEQQRFMALDTAAYKENLAKLGIFTPLEHDAYDVVNFASMALQNFVNHADAFDNGAEILQQKWLVEEIRVSPETFESYLTFSIKDGIRSLEEKYWINLPHTPKPQIINPDFEKKALGWLKDKVYARLSSEGKCSLLEEIMVHQEETGNIRLRKNPD